MSDEPYVHYDERRIWSRNAVAWNAPPLIVLENFRVNQAHYPKGTTDEDLIPVEEARRAITRYLTTFQGNLRDGETYLREIGTTAGAEGLYRLLLYSIKQDISLRFIPFCEYLRSSSYMQTVGRSAADSSTESTKKMYRQCMGCLRQVQKYQARLSRDEKLQSAELGKLWKELGDSAN